MEKTEQKSETEQEQDVTKKLILFNDDVNSMEHVIFTIMGVLGYPMQQAEQLTLIAHNKGKVSVKEGSMEDLLIPSLELSMAKLMVEIQ